MAIITSTIVKTLLQISGTTYDTVIAELIPRVQNFVVEYCQNRFHNGNVYITGSTIVFVDSDPDTITDSDEGFLDAKFPAASIDIDVAGSYYGNNGIYAVDTVVAGTMTLASGESLIAEDAGEGITITLVQFPKGIHLVVADMINFKMNKKRGLKNWRLADYSETTIGEGGYPKQLLKELASFRKFRWP